MSGSGAPLGSLRMPRKLEKKLAARASAKGYRGKRWHAYVYGTLNKVEKQKAAKRHGR